MIEHVLTHKSKIISCLYLLHRSKFLVCKIIVYPVRNAQSLRPKSRGNQKKTTEAWRNGARLLTKIYYSLEDVTLPNATEAFTTKNFYS